MEQTIKVADKPTLDAMQKEITQMQSLLGTLGEGIAGVASAIAAVKADVANVKSAVGTVNNVINTVNTNVNNVKNSVGSIAAEVAEAGDYVFSEPKVLMTTNADASGFPSTSHVYSSGAVTVKGKGFITFISEKTYQYSLYDLVIDGVLVTSGYDTYSHKPSGVDIRSTNHNNQLKPIFFEKSISFIIMTTGANSHHGVTYQVGLK